MSVFLSFLFTGLALAGCQSKQSDAPTPQPIAAAPVPTRAPAPSGSGGRSESRFLATVDGLATANAYRILLDWHGLAPDVEMWRLQRHGAGSGLDLDRTFPAATDTFEDRGVLAGETYRYHLSAMRGGAATLQASVDVLVPRDFEIKGDVTLRLLRNVSRVFFARGSRLFTRGEPLTIDVEEIVSDDGLIATFPEESASAPAQTDGRNAGAVILRAKKGRGVLRIQAYGQRGGGGREGLPGLAGGPGLIGIPGIIAWRRPFVIVGAEVIRRPDIETLTKLPDNRNDVHCFFPPTNGWPGSPGTDGGRGGNGQRGGDAPKVYVEIDNATALHVRPELLPGAGGEGGPGGAGGRGGPGGEPGAPDRFGLCPSARPGAAGRDGLRGPTGEPGPTAMAPDYCLKLTRTVYGDCRTYAGWPEVAW